MNHQPIADTPGTTVWITGLSGAGKSTLAQVVWRKLRDRGEPAVIVDGDAVREIAGNDLGHDPEDRRANAYRIARMCRFLSLQGLDVVCATMSLFHELHAWNRENQPRYLEVFLDVPLETLVARDSKGLYEGARQGEVGDVVGMQLGYEAPRDPDMRFTNDQSAEHLEGFADEIIARVTAPPASAPSVSRGQA